MKFLILMSLIFGLVNPVIAAEKKLTISESNVINVFTSKVYRALVLADGCLTELVVMKKQGLKCKEYKIKITVLNRAYVLVMRIKPNKKRFEAIARNNTWYYAFKDYDRIEVLEKEIDHILLNSK